MRRVVLLCGCLALLVLATVTTADAQLRLTLGFSGGADAYLATGNPTADAPWLARANAVGAQVIRLDVYWSDIEPSRPSAGSIASNPSIPGYHWAWLDSAVRELSAAGLRPLIDVWSAPTWAEAPARPRLAPPGTWRPSVAAFRAFATAIATRYDGHFPDPASAGTTLPRVGYWEGWNEPNLSTYLTPQWVRTKSGWFPESPALYRGLENAFYAAVKSANPANFVVGSATAPYGDPPGGQRMQPVAFVRAEFCLSDRLTRMRCRGPIHIDALDHHPYGIGGPLWHALNPDDVAVPDIFKLTRVLHAAQRAGTVLPKGTKQVWVTEESWDTKPPDPRGVPIQTEARWLEQSLYVLWRQGVSTVLWLQIADSPPVPNYADSYQAGVYYLNGTEKPGATAFRFPFITTRLSRTRVLAWGRAPTQGTVDVELRVDGAWRAVALLRVTAGEIFQARISCRGQASFRAELDDKTSLVWHQQA